MSAAPPSKAPPRLFLLPAKEAPVCAVLAKVRKETWHVLLWDLRAGTLRQGSWFTGSLNPEAADVSWDGEYMVYSATNFARPQPENGWIGLCRLPVLTTLAHVNKGWYCWGGGLFTARDVLTWENVRADPLVKTLVSPFQYKHFPVWDPDLRKDRRTDYGDHMAWRRMRRDGWSEVAGSRTFAWRRPHPRAKLTLTAHLAGMHYPSTGGIPRPFDYVLDQLPDLFSNQTLGATWDAQGDLLWTEGGCLYRAHPEDLIAGGGAFQKFDLNGLKKPPRDPETGAPSPFVVSLVEESPL